RRPAVGGLHRKDIDRDYGIYHHKRLEEWLTGSYGGSHAGPTRSRHDEQGGADDMSIPATTSAHHAVPPGLDWDADPRWRQVRRDYRPEDVLRLRPSLPVEHTLARHGAERLWELLS